MCMSGQGSALELVTASTDGTLCQWDTSRLNEPTNVSTLTTPNSSQVSVWNTTILLCVTLHCDSTVSLHVLTLLDFVFLCTLNKFLLIFLSFVFLLSSARFSSYLSFFLFFLLTKIFTSFLISQFHTLTLFSLSHPRSLCLYSVEEGSQSIPLRRE